MAGEQLSCITILIKQQYYILNINLLFLSKVLQHLQAVNFTTNNGERVYFDSQGDSPARYDLVNLQITKKGTMEGVTVGIYDASLAESHQFLMNNISVVWGGGLNEVTLFVPIVDCSSYMCCML